MSQDNIKGIAMACSGRRWHYSYAAAAKCNAYTARVSEATDSCVPRFGCPTGKGIKAMTPFKAKELHFACLNRCPWNDISSKPPYKPMHTILCQQHVSKLVALGPHPSFLWVLTLARRQHGICHGRRRDATATMTYSDMMHDLLQHTSCCNTDSSRLACLMDRQYFPH